jgi:hypothetical protein
MPVRIVVPVGIRIRHTTSTGWNLYHLMQLTGRFSCLSISLVNNLKALFSVDYVYIASVDKTIDELLVETIWK